MSPLSIWTYIRRHKRHTVLLFGLSVIVTIGVYSLVALVWGVFVEPASSSYTALSEFSLVRPEYDENGPNPSILAQIQANPDVARVIPTSFIRIELPGMLPAAGFQFDLYGLLEEDVPYILERCGAVLLSGQLPEPGTNGLLLSEDTANLLNVELGDTYEVLSAEFYPYVDTPIEATPFEVVGILKSDIELGIISREYLNEHVLYSQFPVRFLVVAQENRDAVVDDFLRNGIQLQTTQTPGAMQTTTMVMTLSLLNERIISEALPTLLTLLPIILVVVMAFSLVIVVVNQIANTQRLPEFGVLHATGHSKHWLARRLTMETSMVALAGWVVGIGLSFLLIYLLKLTFFAPRGYQLDYIVWLPVALSLLIPALITGTTFIRVRRTFSRLDPVSIVEQGVLSQEKNFEQERSVSKSSPKPLTSATFFKRHQRRAVLLIGVMSLLILAVVLVLFTSAIGADMQKSLVSYLNQVTMVSLSGVDQGIDPGFVAQIQAHPAVEKVIPIAPSYHLLGVSVPPFINTDTSPLGVYAEDMNYLIQLYGLELKEGRLPRPYTNEMVVPETLAKNRELKVGDVIGNPGQPAYPGAPSLETEFVISGIFANPADSQSGNWLGFYSLEFLESEQPFPLPKILPLIVVPKSGQKDVLDNWLEIELTDMNVSVVTYGQEISRIQVKAQQDMLGMVLLESLIAVIAALGLAVLFYFYISQRQSEFGLLYALGYGRRQLVGRVFRETTFTILTAWCLCTVIALTLMLAMRFFLFEPIGLTFQLFNLTPWIYTLPIPVIVLAITTGTTARTISKLDPITIIERRP